MIIKAIFKKEICSYKRAFRMKLTSTIGALFFFFLVTYFKANKVNSGVYELRNIINYSSIIVAYMVFISNLRFWYEKSMNMLENIFMLPCKMYKIIIGKTLLPVIMSLIAMVIFYISIHALISVLRKIFTFSIYDLLVIILFTIIFEISYSVINCYVMWCSSMTYAKIIQFISFSLYLGSVFIVFLAPKSLNLMSSKVVWIALASIALYASFCYLRISKERALITLHV